MSKRRTLKKIINKKLSKKLQRKQKQSLRNNLSKKSSIFLKKKLSRKTSKKSKRGGTYNEDNDEYGEDDELVEIDHRARLLSVNNDNLFRPINQNNQNNRPENPVPMTNLMPFIVNDEEENKNNSPTNDLISSTFFTIG